ELLNTIYTNEREKILHKIGDIDTDGHSSTLELHVNPSPDPKILTNRFAAIFKELYKRTKILELSTLSYKGPVGGHIHFELPEEIQDKTINELTKILTTFYLPCLLSEDTVNIKMRQNRNYGLMDHEDQIRRIGRQQGAQTLEFRIPTAEWLTTPKITTSTLAYLKTVYYEAINNPDIFLETPLSQIIYTNIEQAQALQTLSVNNFEYFIKDIVRIIKRKIKSFALYEEYKKEINYILTPHKVKKDKTECNYDVFAGWNMKKKKTDITKRDFVNEKNTNILYDTTNTYNLEGLINFEYNKDRNVELFINELTKRVFAHGWIPQQKYFFFGMRKGIPCPIAFTNTKFLYGWQDLNSIKAIQLLKKYNESRIKIFSNKQSNSKHTWNANKININTNNIILVGIPHRDRINNNIKPFIELMYDLENNKYTTDVSVPASKAKTSKKDIAIYELFAQKNKQEDYQENQKSLDHLIDKSENLEYDKLRERITKEVMQNSKTETQPLRRATRQRISSSFFDMINQQYVIEDFIQPITTN
ncbi:MAG: hypothetical protein Q8P11_04345, partial [bacterium]|nr:hypothetical protein [bacterium]